MAAELIREACRVLKSTGEIIVTEWEQSSVFWRNALFLPVKLLEPKPYHKFMKKDLYQYFRKYGLEIKGEIHCDYSKVLKLGKIKKVG